VAEEEEAAEDQGHNGAPEARRLLLVCRRSQQRLAGIVEPLDEAGLERTSYADDWSVAEVLSHLGSQSEIFSLFVEAALGEGEPPTQDAFGSIWDRWNAKSPTAQRADSLATDDRLLRRIEGLDDDQLAAAHVEMFGSDVGIAGLLHRRLPEHALHTWDVAVIFDEEAEVAADAVEVIVDELDYLVSRVGRPAAHPTTVAVNTERPERHFVLDTAGVELRSGSAGAAASVDLSAEAFVRLVYGRLTDTGLPRDKVHTRGASLEDLRAVFTGV